jgi:hypothetical protein
MNRLRSLPHNQGSRGGVETPSPSGQTPDTQGRPTSPPDIDDRNDVSAYLVGALNWQFSNTVGLAL